MSGPHIGMALCEPPDVYDDGDRVAERIACMSWSELREACGLYRLRRAVLGCRPYGYRFGEWLRDRVSGELAREDRDSGPDGFE